jgi:hypothetical protein
MIDTRRSRGGFTTLALVVAWVLAAILALVFAALFALAPAGSAEVGTVTLSVSEPSAKISTPPGGGDVLLVLDYFDGKDRLVGQFWSGCGQPSGGWGVRQGRLQIFTPAC